MASRRACALLLSVRMSVPVLRALPPGAQSCKTPERVLPWESARSPSGASWKVDPLLGAEGDVPKASLEMSVASFPL